MAVLTSALRVLVVRLGAALAGKARPSALASCAAMWGITLPRVRGKSLLHATAHGEAQSE